jgi:hypothetical protein
MEAVVINISLSIESINLIEELHIASDGVNDCACFRVLDVNCEWPIGFVYWIVVPSYVIG